jgi:hypothetical protein
LPPTPPNSGARIIDLSRPPVEITEQGLYVFDRNWNVVPSFLDGTIVITADNVTLDLQGFELSTEELAIRSTGRGVTVRNGRVNAAFGGAIRVSGADSLIERVEADVGHGGAIHLGGAGSTLSESSVSVGEFATGVHAGDDTIVRGNRLGSRFIALSAASRTTLVDNEILCGIADPCIEVEGTENIISRNAIRETVDVAAVGIAILGDNNHAMDNLFLPDCDFPPSGLTAIAVEGRGNTVRDNLLAGCSGFAGWAIGLRFTRDGNFYGDNVMWATSPFSVGATVQRDLGGNAGFSN